MTRHIAPWSRHSASLDNRSRSEGRCTVIDFDELPPEDVVEIGMRKSPANLLRLAAAMIRNQGTLWLAEWLMKEALKREAEERSCAE